MDQETSNEQVVLCKHIEWIVPLFQVLQKKIYDYSSRTTMVLSVMTPVQDGIFLSKKKVASEIKSEVATIYKLNYFKVRAGKKRWLS